MIDNYDSFTYNLVQRIGELDPSIELQVHRNDKITVEQALQLKPSHVIVSPGPCTPNEAGVSMDIIKAFAGQTPILGVCLGHQSIGQAYNMIVERNDRIMHGKTSPIHHNNQGVFKGLPNPCIATRYHSLVINRESFDSERFEITAWTEEGEIMGLRSKENVFGPAAMEGVQFHPESFLTREGPIMFANFLGLPHPEIKANTAI